MIRLLTPFRFVRAFDCLHWEVVLWQDTHSDTLVWWSEFASPSSKFSLSMCRRPPRSTTTLATARSKQQRVSASWGIFLNFMQIVCSEAKIHSAPSDWPTSESSGHNLSIRGAHKRARNLIDVVPPLSYSEITKYLTNKLTKIEVLALIKARRFSRHYQE